MARLLFVALLSLVCVSARASSTVQLLPNLSPVRAPDGMGGFLYVSPSFAAYQANVLAGLAAGGVATGTGPSAFEPLSRTDFSPNEALGTPFHSWRGDLSPTGPYAGEFGTYIRIAALVTSSTVFTTNDVYLSTVASDFSVPEFSLGSAYPFDEDFAGLSYGADGVRGGGDDTFYASGAANASTALNELYYTGAAFVNLFYGDAEVAAFGGPEATLAANNAYYAMFAPYEFDTTLTLRSGDLTLASTRLDATITAVPEPATTALLGAGVIMLLASAQHRRRRH